MHEGEHLPDAFCDMLPDALWASPQIAAREVFNREKSRPEAIARRFLFRKARLFPALAKLLRQDLDDWQQEACIKFFLVLRERLEAWQVDGSLAYAARSAWNHLRDCWKTNKSRSPHYPRREGSKKPATEMVSPDSLDLREGGSPKPVLQLLAAENVTLVREALKELRRHDCFLHEVAVLKFLRGQTAAEIARGRSLDERGAQRAVLQAGDWLKRRLLGNYRANFQEFLSAEESGVV